MADDITDRARAALEGITEGEWRHSADDDGECWVVEVDDQWIASARRIENARFIAASRSLVPELLVEVERLREEAEDYHNLIGRQGDLLTATVNALRGEPPELTTWSHHDVAELAAGLTSERARDRAEVSFYREWSNELTQYIPEEFDDDIAQEAIISNWAKFVFSEVERLRGALERPAIDANHIDGQRAFSETTFGPGRRTEGVVDHIRRELLEVLAAPDDLSEWADVIILALDGAWRTGASSQAIIDAIKAKQARNEQRNWPDWRTAEPGKAIEHVRAPHEAVLRGGQ